MNRISFVCHAVPILKLPYRLNFLLIQSFKKKIKKNKKLMQTKKLIPHLCRHYLSTASVFFHCLLECGLLSFTLKGFNWPSTICTDIFQMYSDLFLSKEGCLHGWLHPALLKQNHPWNINLVRNPRVTATVSYVQQSTLNNVGHSSQLSNTKYLPSGHLGQIHTTHIRGQLWCLGQ